MMPVERCTQLLPQIDTYNLDQEKSLLARGRKAVFVCDWKKKCPITGSVCLLVHWFGNCFKGGSAVYATAK